MSYSTGKITKIVAEDDTHQEVVVEQSTNTSPLTVLVGDRYQPLAPAQRYSVGQSVVLMQQTTESGDTWIIADHFRLSGMLWLLIGFLTLVMFVGKKQGLLAIVGMILSMVVLFGWIVPNILSGHSPVLVTLFGAGAVAICSLYLSHGVHRHTHVAVASLWISLLAVGVLSSLAVAALKLTGLGSEEAAFLQFENMGIMNLRGLLLAGMMIGALGVLDDICVSQVEIVEQLHQANPTLKKQELIARGLVVGKSHVASLVNTLLFAYAASSLPLFLLFQSQSAQPAWVVLNSELIAEEVVRTLTGSIGLVLAVPLATILAATFITKNHRHKTDTTH